MNRTYNGKPADIWALGVLLYTMLSGYYPFYEPSTSHLIRIIRTRNMHIPEHFSFPVKKLLNQILRKGFRYRITIEGIFLSSWLKSIQPLHKQIKVHMQFSSSFDEDNETPENDFYQYTHSRNMDGQTRSVTVTICPPSSPDEDLGDEYNEVNFET